MYPIKANNLSELFRRCDTEVNLNGFSAFVREMAQRKRAEEALSRSEAEYRGQPAVLNRSVQQPPNDDDLWPKPPLEVLVVDDDPTIRRTVGRAGRRYGLEVDEADGGAEALRLLEDRWYDAVLLDLRMPRMDGFQVYGSLADSNAAQAKRVVFMTGYWQDPKCHLFVPATGRLHLVKPFGSHKLIAAILQVSKPGERSSSNGGAMNTKNTNFEDWDNFLKG